jgi:hypothetical protein
MLGEFVPGGGKRAEPFVIDDGPGTRRALVKGKDVFHREKAIPTNSASAGNTPGFSHPASSATRHFAVT